MIRALAAALLLAGCATVERECAGPEWGFKTYSARLAAADPGIAWVEFSNVEKESYSRAFNAAPPVRTGFVFDRVGYFKSHLSRNVLVVSIVGDCVWLETIAPEGQVRALLGNGA